MNRRRPLLVASAGVPMLALSLVLTLSGHVIGQSSTPGPGIAAPLAADYVTLEDVFEQPGSCESGVSTERIFPDGTRAPFAVPRGRVLVLTDVDGTVSSAYPAVWDASHVGHIASLRVRVQSSGQTHWFDALTQVNSAAVSAQVLPVQNHLQTGVAAGAGSLVCVGAIISMGNGGFVAKGRARIHGYLMNQ